MNLHCDKRGCNHNSGFEYSCMYGISADLIREANSCNLMCEHLRKNILELEKLFCKDMVERIVERLEEEKKIFTEAWENTDWTPDKIAYINTVSGICKSIEIVKKESELHDNA